MFKALFNLRLAEYPSIFIESKTVEFNAIQYKIWQNHNF